MALKQKRKDRICTIRLRHSLVELNQKKDINCHIKGFAEIGHLRIKNRNQASIWTIYTRANNNVSLLFLKNAFDKIYLSFVYTQVGWAANTFKKAFIRINLPA